MLTSLCPLRVTVTMIYLGPLCGTILVPNCSSLADRSFLDTSHTVALKRLPSNKNEYNNCTSSLAKLELGCNMSLAINKGYFRELQIQPFLVRAPCTKSTASFVVRHKEDNNGP